MQPSPIDWQAVRASGVEAAYVRALIGRDTRDERVVEHCNGARVAGLDVGVYGLVYPRHGRAQDADEQGRQLAAIHREVGATLIPMLDCEDGPPGPPTGGEWRDAWAAWRDAVASELGALPGWYASPAFVLERPELLAELQRVPCPWWAAAYVDEAPSLPGLSWVAWQFQGGGETLPARFRGRCDGVRGDCDRSRLAAGVSVETLRI